jgi:alpha-tubulin suppressor-like RCC1 family protein
MSAGDYATCGIAGGSQLYCWGAYNGDAWEVPTVVDVAAKQIVIRGSSSCVIGTADHLWCGGDNEYGQVGDHTYTVNTAGSEVVEVGTVRSVAINDELGCAVTLGTGDVWCWGNNDRGQLGRGTLSSSPTPVLAAP